MKDQIKDTKAKIIEILKKHNIKKASLFGSIVRGELTESSDIDILIEFEGRKSLIDLVGLKLELEEIIGRKIDLLTYNSLHPLLKDKILETQEIII